ncbi:DUF2949 domain-containing protein [Pleurocapsales cyanobacterium LEGE 06147]|nr:DUF2949 domain-containing protein [Pleurocapsales cyanobacterium LEGE 06147]
MPEKTFSCLEVNESRKLNLLISFLRKSLGISEDSLTIALRQSQQLPHLLPMSLWQYGLISLEQLEQIFDWWEAVS